MMAAQRTMSERTRAFEALKGVRYPTVGERAQWSDIRYDHWVRFTLVVVRVSASGKTVWTRFVAGTWETFRYGRGPHRWERWAGDSRYRASAWNRDGAPTGVLCFEFEE